MSRKVNLKKTENQVENVGTSGQRKALTVKQIKLIKSYLSSRETLLSKRDLALFSVAVDTMLRSVDLLKLKVSDFIDNDGLFREVIEIKQQKTKKIVVVEISTNTQESVAEWIESSEKSLSDYLFTGFTRNNHKPLSRVHYAVMIKSWISDILGIDSSEYSTHSLRRTKASLVYSATQNVEVVRQLLGQSSITATSAYLNIGKKDALRLARETVSV